MLLAHQFSIAFHVVGTNSCCGWPTKDQPLQDVQMADVVLENGLHKGGWAAIHFSTVEDAAVALHE